MAPLFLDPKGKIKAKWVGRFYICNRFEAWRAVCRAGHSWGIRIIMNIYTHCLCACVNAGQLIKSNAKRQRVHAKKVTTDSTVLRNNTRLRRKSRMQTKKNCFAPDYYISTNASRSGAWCFLPSVSLLGSTFNPFNAWTLVKQHTRKPWRIVYNLQLKHLEAHKPRKTRFQSVTNVSKKKIRKSKVSKPAGLQNKAKPSKRHRRDSRLPWAPLYGLFPSVTY